jgi:hypothetical protein
MNSKIGILSTNVSHLLITLKEHKNFERLNSETGNLLIWMYLKQSQREIHDTTQDLE